MTIIRDLETGFKDHNVFSIAEARRQLGRTRSKNLSRILSYMKANGMIYSLGHGTYTFNRNLNVSGFAYSPFYYGLMFAMTIRELWDQNSRPDILTPRKVRISNIKVFNGEESVFVHHVPIKLFFGFDMVKYGGIKVPVSDPEKTLIDLFYYRVKLSTGDYGGILKAVSYDKLNKYLKFYDVRLASTVMKFAKRYKPAADSGRLSDPY